MEEREGAPEPIDTRVLLEALRDPRAYPGDVDEVCLLQTHISFLFFAGDRVYKVKRPVDRGFLDYTELASRYHYCQEEVRLNRRLAPDVYRRVVPICRQPDGSLRVGGQGDPVEWAVEMELLPEEGMLSRLLERGVIDNARIQALVELLVGFHAAAATGEGVDEHGEPSAIAHNVEENWTQLAPFTSEPCVLSRCQLDFLRERARAGLTDRHDTFLRRVAEGRIREGHGDLHAGNVCFTPQGVVAYDCIEFNRRFRCGDVASDLAFLAMDLDYRGFHGFARYLAKRYAREANDPELETVLPFYKGYRAVVRGKVTAMAAADAGLPEERRDELRREAMRYLQLAAGYELPPAVILMCGLPATGKSWLARHLQRPLRAALIQSDVRRKIHAHMAPTQSARAAYGTGLYSPENRDRTYRSLREDVVQKLGTGYPLIVDATFSTPEYRRPFVDLATRLDLPYLVLHIDAPDAVICERLRQRAGRARGASDAGIEVYERARSVFEPPAEVPSGHVLELLSADAAPEDLCSEVFDRLICLANEAGAR